MQTRVLLPKIRERKLLVRSKFFIRTLLLFLVLLMLQQARKVPVVLKNEKLTIYSRLRTDRSGAVLFDILTAHAFAFSENLVYGGACTDESHDYEYKTNHIRLLEAMGLKDEFPFVCPKDNFGKVLERPEYDKKGMELFTPEWLSYLRRKVTYRQKPPGSENITQVSVHIRRGDILPCKSRRRYSPNSHYLNILDRIIEMNNSTTNFNITIHSERQTFESWKEFEHRNYTLNLEGDLVATWESMINADIFVMSQSDFSLVAGLFNRGRVIYTPYFHGPLQHWEIVNWRIMRKSELEVKQMKKNFCPNGK